ncbi:hypothetical protein [Terracoccus luteus]|uniref:Uncharacterized protein n=1 Tax=Terracoccus luteus TaxID=53356 RepID=A0A839PY46_9MICO|nr:hypothetical protein [Terracoccus luteus]MBB2988447.1 hypothetical protein [Terracoccus luteus]MCP2174098.1 hypothetical protein [Terracoccus luteus]
MSKQQSRDFALEAHRAAVQHLADCHAAMDAQDEFEGPDEDFPDSPASAPFNGCDDCQVRETLHAAWPVLYEAVLADQPPLVRVMVRWHAALDEAVATLRSGVARRLSRSTR